MNLHKRILTENACYKAGRTITPKGIMVHSTGANNPSLKRYVGPDDGLLGKNQYNNHWNQDRPGGRQVCVHAFIGKFAGGEVGTVQTLPWNRRAWHCGSGRKGSGNDTHIAFEICEDGLTDPAYFQAVYWEAVELTAMLCKEYGLDPLADGVVICHAEGCKRGIASNHGDVLHWFPRHGKNMDDFRSDVARTMKGEESMSYEQFKAYMEQYRKELGGQPVPGWAQTEHETARAAGLTDGSRPNDFCTRQEAVSFALRAVRAKK